MSTNTSSLHIFQILRIVAESDLPLGVADVARETALPTSTVYRALLTLAEARYLSRDEGTAKYRVGEMPLILLKALFNRFPIKDLAWPALKALANETGETVSLTMRIGWYGVRIAAAPGSKGTRYKERVGLSQLLHRGAAQRLMLAGMTELEIGAYRRFIRRNYPQLAGEVDHSALLKDLRTLREQGYATSPVSLDNGYEFAMPLRASSGEIGVIQITGPAVSKPEPRDDARVPSWFARRDAIEAAARAEPERFRSPFWHMNPDDILLRAGHEWRTSTHLVS